MLEFVSWVSWFQGASYVYHKRNIFCVCKIGKEGVLRNKRHFLKCFQNYILHRKKFKIYFQFSTRLNDMICRSNFVFLYFCFCFPLCAFEKIPTLLHLSNSLKSFDTNILLLFSLFSGKLFSLYRKHVICRRRMILRF